LGGALVTRAWKKLGELSVADHHVLKVRALRVQDPRNGKEYPRVTLECTDWVNVVALTDDDRLVLIRQFRFGTWRDTLEIPGGMVDPGEDPRAAAARELEEETGFRPRQVVPVGISEPNPALQNNRLHHFLATGCVQVHAGAQEESEDIEVELHPVSKIDDLVLTGEVSHALVITALYYWRLKARG
jgi:8-oxo-dGTP pyrophosphatase MutT (NUDIX family)